MSPNGAETKLQPERQTDCRPPGSCGFLGSASIAQESCVRQGWLLRCAIRLWLKRTSALHCTCLPDQRTSDPQPETAQTIIGSHLRPGKSRFQGVLDGDGFIPSRQGHCISCVWASDGHWPRSDLGRAHYSAWHRAGACRRVNRGRSALCHLP
jgi:hypothetical protein